MNAAQKRAWVVVITGTVCVAGYLLAMPFVGPRLAIAVFGLFGIVGFTALMGRGEKSDERDNAINRYAALAGAMISYLVFILSCMGTWAVVYSWNGHEHVSVHTLANITGLGGFAFFMGHAIAVLMLYGRHVEADHG